MRLNCGYETKKARVEMLPLIDVVFLLLVFFIYAMLSMVVHHGLTVDLPEAGTAILDHNTFIGITLDADNRIYLENDPVDLNQLPSRILAMHEADARPVFIDGDRDADLGLAIQVLDLLKESGIEEVSFSCKTSSP